MSVGRMEPKLRIAGDCPDFCDSKNGTVPFTAAPFTTARVRDLDVGVIYTGERALMAPLLSTMRASSGNLRYRLLLVDNDSSDGVATWQNTISDTAILKNDRRLSYAANMNRIVAASSARYVLLMNTDMFFDPRQNCLSRMVSFMDAHPDCGIAGCRILHADGRDARAARRFQTFNVVLARRFGLGRWMPRTLDRYFYRDHAPGDSFDSQWLSGCFLMLRKQAIEEVGPVDESFGKYFEDVDICLRMSRAGWRVMHHGATSAYHIEQRASRRAFSTDGLRHFRAYIHWLRKWGYRAPAEVVPVRKVAKAA